MNALNRWKISILLISVTVLLISCYCIKAKIKYNRKLSNYEKDIQYSIEFLDSIDADLYLFGYDDLNARKGLKRNQLPFHFYIGDEVDCTDEGIWHEIEHTENSKLVYHKFSGEALYDIDISPLEVIDSVDMSGDGRYVVYSGWYSIGLSGMSCDYVYICDLQSGEKKFLFEESERGTLFTIKSSYDGQVLYYICNNRVYSYDADSGDTKDIMAGLYVFAFNNGDIGVVDYDECYKYYKVDTQNFTKKLVYQTDIPRYVTDWDSTGRYISSLCPGRYGSWDKQKIERVPQVYDIETENLYLFPYGYFGDLIHFASKTGEGGDRGHMTIWSMKYQDF